MPDASFLSISLAFCCRASANQVKGPDTSGHFHFYSARNTFSVTPITAHMGQSLRLRAGMVSLEVRYPNRESNLNGFEAGFAHNSSGIKDVPNSGAFGEHYA
jgi:hypothetical protein